jgi:hypothetical protein
MPRSLEEIARYDVPITNPQRDVTRFWKSYSGTIWDNFMGVEGDYLMMIGGTTGPGFAELTFAAMREVDGPVSWREAYRYVGNPLDLSRPRG